MKITFLITALLTLEGCVINHVQVSVPYSYTDDVDNKKIDLIFENKNFYPVCLDFDSWPDNRGVLHTTSDTLLYLIVADKRYQIKPFNSGHCMGNDFDCTTRVKRGEKTETFLKYELFDLPEKYFTHSKALIYKPSAYICYE